MEGFSSWMVPLREGVPTTKLLGGKSPLLKAVHFLVAAVFLVATPGVVCGELLTEKCLRSCLTSCSAHSEPQCSLNCLRSVDECEERASDYMQHAIMQKTGFRWNEGKNYPSNTLDILHGDLTSGERTTESSGRNSDKAYVLDVNTAADVAWELKLLHTDESMAQHSNPNHRRKTIQLSGAEQRFLTTWRRHAGVSRETEERWEPAAHNSYGGAGVSVVMNGSRCSWQCPLTCSIKYLPGCTNDCLESRRWCLKYADVSETSASTDADDLDNCIESFPMCTGQRKDDTTGPFRHLDDLGTPSKRFLAGKHVRLPPSSAGAFVFRRTLESVSRRDQQSTEGFGESENYDETELVDSVSHVVVGEPKAAPEATSVEISKTPDEGGRFRGGSRQKLRACRIISDASTDCDGNSEDGTSYSPVAVGDSLKDGENIRLQKRSSALRK